MRTVLKITLQVVNGPQPISAPGEWKVLHFAAQYGEPTLWIEVDTTSAIPWQRRFHVVGTGGPVPEDGVYVGTCQVPPFVWHVYETPTPAPEGTRP